MIPNAEIKTLPENKKSALSNEILPIRNSSNKTFSQIINLNNENNHSIITRRTKATAPPPTPDPLWVKRGKAAYGGLTRTDPDAIWSFQGFAFEFWKNTPDKAAALKGFIDSAPKDKFVIFDMDYGEGEWLRSRLGERSNERRSNPLACFQRPKKVFGTLGII